MNKHQFKANIQTVIESESQEQIELFLADLRSNLLESTKQFRTALVTLVLASLMHYLATSSDGTELKIFSPE